MIKRSKLYCFIMHHPNPRIPPQPSLCPKNHSGEYRYMSCRLLHSFDYVLYHYISWWWYHILCSLQPSAYNPHTPQVAGAEGQSRK